MDHSNKATSPPAAQKRGWWDSRTKVEKCSILLLALASITIVYLASNLFMKFPSSKTEIESKVCMTDKCIVASAEMLRNIDKKVDPCDDFYKFTCGNFIRNAEIPEDRVMVSSVGNLQERVQLNLRNIYEQPIKPSEQKYVKLVKTIYKSCMNQTTIQNESLNYFKRKFDELGGWPVLNADQFIENTFDWKKLLYRLQRTGLRRTIFFSMYVVPDFKNSSKRILTINQPCFDSNMKKGMNDSLVQAKHNYLVSLARLFGAHPATATEQMKEVIEFEIELAKITIASENRTNASLEYNPMTIRNLQKNFSSIPWQQFINVYLAPVEMLGADDVVNVGEPKFLKNLKNLLQRTRRRTLANYMYSRVVRDYVFYLPEEFQAKELQYTKQVSGQEQTLHRWKECTWRAKEMNLAVSAIYLQNFFNTSLQHEIMDLVLDVKASFIEMLKKNAWMDKKTKRHALLKAEKMKSMVAFPYEMLNDKNINKYYEDLELNSDDFYLDNLFNISQFAHRKHVEELKQPVDKNDWKFFGAALDYVNAYYSWSYNSIELPAGLLQDNFYNPYLPHYMNYGSLGYVIGHEITHGFDDTGRQYDKDGNVLDWWESETNRTFTKKIQCLAEQYGNYTIPELNINLNGLKNLGENIADNGGIKIAYKSYQRWLQRTNNIDEFKLPGLDYSPKQMFWIAAAQNWCAKYKKKFLKNMVMQGHHSPNYFRVVIPFMNSDHFARDFKCPLGSNMNPKYKCRIW